MPASPKHPPARPRAPAAQHSALALLVERERSKTVARLCRTMSKADAEDCYQNACLRALERLQQQRDPAQLRAWFRTVLVTVLSRRHAAHLLASAPLSESRPAPRANMPCGCGLDALATLSPSRRELLQRSSFDAQTARQLARAANVSAGNIRVQLHRARAQLRERWERRCGPCIRQDHGVRCTCTRARDPCAP